MRLQKITVKNLYGIFNHEIPMDMPEGVTIIYGSNGFGKTVMLKMIASALNGDISIFRSTPFDEFRMEFSDKTALSVTRRAAEGTIDAVIKVFAINEKGVETELNADRTNVPEPVLDLIDRRVPPPYRRMGTGWKDDEGRSYSPFDIYRLFPDAFEAMPSALIKDLSSGFVRSHLHQQLKVFVVEANRLESSRGPTESPDQVRPRYASSTKREPSNRVLRVQQYSNDVVQLIKSVLADYAKFSQERDRTFPERLVQFVRQHQETLGEKKILEQMQELEKKRQRLINLGFLDSETGLRDLTEEEIRRSQEALTIYVSDVQAKLSAFDEMAQRVGKLIDIINERFDYKRLVIHREQGFCVLSDSDVPIQLADLSSGEQHELVLLYELLFRTPRNGLILVDEPEISLHVAWQSRFLSDLIDIVKLNDAYAVVATHSPVLIGTQWGLTKELAGPPVKMPVEGKR